MKKESKICPSCGERNNPTFNNCWKCGGDLAGPQLSREVLVKQEVARDSAWLRWMAVLPGALFVGIIASFPLHWVLYATLTSFIEPYPESPERVLFPFVMAVAFVWAGSYIAPSHKFKTAVILCGVWLFLLGVFVFLTLTGSDFAARQLYFQGGGLGPIMAAAGALAGLFIVKKTKW